MYLASSCDRQGLRVEALMVAALFSTSRTGADHVLVERAMAAVRAACPPVLMATAANFAEVAAECGELKRHRQRQADGKRRPVRGARRP